jgi:uncharacterized protein
VVEVREAVTSTAALAVTRPLLTMRWDAVSYVHWAVDPERVAAVLPRCLEPDVHDGTAWVGLVPFQMAAIGLHVGGRGPLRLPAGRFPETNVRTYVVGPDGGRGVYFHSLDITRAAPTVVARLGYRLPYAWSRMRLGRRGAQLAYRSQRRWPGPAGASAHVRVEVGLPVPPEEVTALDRFLTARWSLYVDSPGGTILRAHVEHPPWPLRAARLLHLRDDLVRLAGYGELARRPPDHVRYGGDVPVRVGPPRRVGRAS